MAFIPSGGTARVSILGRQDSQLVVNTLYFQVLSPPVTIFNLTNLVNGVNDWWASTILPLLSEQYVYEQSIARDLTSEFSFSASDGTGAGPGGVGQEAAPNNVAACISFRTGFVGRSFRGRNYIPGIPNPEITLNTLSDTFKADTQAGYEGLIALSTTFGWTWVVASFHSGGAPRTSGVVTQVNSVLYTDSTVDSQRRRLPGRGA